MRIELSLGRARDWLSRAAHILGMGRRSAERRPESPAAAEHGGPEHGWASASSSFLPAEADRGEPLHQRHALLLDGARRIGAGCAPRCAASWAWPGAGRSSTRGMRVGRMARSRDRRDEAIVEVEAGLGRHGRGRSRAAAITGRGGCPGSMRMSCTAGMGCGLRRVASRLDDRDRAPGATWATAAAGRWAAALRRRASASAARQPGRCGLRSRRGLAHLGERLVDAGRDDGDAHCALERFIEGRADDDIGLGVDLFADAGWQPRRPRRASCHGRR